MELHNDLMQVHIQGAQNTDFNQYSETLSLSKIKYKFTQIPLGLELDTGKEVS